MSHVSETHNTERPASSFTCNKCSHQFTNQNDLKQHITIVHQRNNSTTPPEVIDIEDSTPPNTDWCLLVGDSHVKTVNRRQIEKSLQGNLKSPATFSPREGSAYTTTREWPGAYYPDNNLCEQVPKLLAERPYKSMIVLTPSNNIKNLENMDRQKQNELAIQTSADTIAIVEKALAENDTLEKVVVAELPPRTDSFRLDELTEFCNFTLRMAAEKSTWTNQITIASLESLNDYTDNKIFGSPSYYKYDGIHMRGKLGGKVYTSCILAALSAAGLCSTRPTAALTHTPTSNYYEALLN